MMGLSLSDQGSASFEAVAPCACYSLESPFGFSSISYLVFGRELTLALLVSEVAIADNHDATLATNNFALFANLLHAWLNFHDCPPSTYNGKRCDLV